MISFSSEDPLVPAGWDDYWHQTLRHFAGDLPPDARPGRVSRADRGRCDVLLARDDGALGSRRAVWGPRLVALAHEDPTALPAAGDWVAVRLPSDAPGEATVPVVELVLPRRTAVVRAQAAAGSSHGQVLAANPDVVAVVDGMDPEPDPGRLERLLALAWSSGASPLVVLTKSDLVTAPHEVVADVAALAPGVDVLGVSCTGATGLEPLRELLGAGRTVALVGASGAGKSTLLNALVGGQRMATRALGAANKGRHTTVTRELHLVPGGGAVLDTPGLRSVGLRGGESLDDVFSDVEELASRCRFDDCAHLREPGCAVLAALDTGALSERRLASYRKLLREAEYQASRVDARVRAERARRWRTVHREARSRTRP